jgi:hypothetical protein
VPGDGIPSCRDRFSTAPCAGCSARSRAWASLRTIPGREVVTAGGRVLALARIRDRRRRRDARRSVRGDPAIVRRGVRVRRPCRPGGVVPVDLLLPEQATCVAEAGGGAPDLDDLVAALSMGYASRLGLEVATSQELRRRTRILLARRRSLAAAPRSPRARARDAAAYWRCTRRARAAASPTSVCAAT